MIIDSHTHMGSFGGVDSSAEALLRMADKLGFERILCSHGLSLYYDMEEGDRLLAEAMRRYPDRIMGYVVVPTAWWGPDALEHVVRGVEEYGMVGLKIYTPPRYLMDWDVLVSVNEPYMYPIIAKAAEYHLPILAHASPQECEGLAQAVPEAVILMAHMGGTAIARGDWRRAIAAAQRYPNIYLETSSSTVDMGYIEATVEAIGPERVIFGTDMLFLDPHVQLAKITGAELTQEAKELILGGNIARLLGLDR